MPRNAATASRSSCRSLDATLVMSPKSMARSIRWTGNFFSSARDGTRGLPESWHEAQRSLNTASPETAAADRLGADKTKRKPMAIADLMRLILAATLAKDTHDYTLNDSPREKL